MVQCANIIRDRFLIIVEYNDQIFLQATRVIDSFQGHTTCQGTITNNGDDFEMFTLQVTCYRQAECCRDGSTGMASSKHVIGAFLAAQVARKTAKLTNGMETIAATGQKFMYIGLVSNIPDQ